VNNHIIFGYNAIHAQGHYYDFSGSRAKNGGATGADNESRVWGEGVRSECLFWCILRLFL